MLKKIGILLLLVSLLTGCKEAKREEALSTINEINCEKTGISFRLNGLWKIEERNNQSSSQKIELSAKNTETNDHILVYYEEIDKKEGGEILREEDYIENIIENLKISEEYNYAVGERENISLFNKKFISFTAYEDDMDAVQKYYINSNDEIITVMVITTYGTEEALDIKLLAKSN